MGERLGTRAGVGTRGMVGAWLGDGTNSALGRGSGRDRRSGQMVHLEIGTISASGLGVRTICASSLGRTASTQVWGGESGGHVRLARPDRADSAGRGIVGNGGAIHQLEKLWVVFIDKE